MALRSTGGYADGTILGASGGVLIHEYVIEDNSGTYEVKKSSDGSVAHSSTDLGAEITWALDNLTSDQGSVFVASMDATLTSDIQFDNQFVTLEFSQGCILSVDGGSVSPVFKMRDTTQRSEIRIINPHIVNTNVSNLGTCIDFSHFAFSKIIDPWIDDFTVCIDCNSSDTFYNSIIRPQCKPKGTSSYGIRFDNGANKNMAEDGRVNGDASATCYYVNANGCELRSCDAEPNALVGLEVGASGHGLVASVYLDTNATNILLASGVEAVFITGKVNGGTTANITDNGADNPNIHLWLEGESYHQGAYNNMKFNRQATLTVSGQAVTANGNYFLINTASAAQTLDTVNGLREGMIVIIGTSSSSNACTLTEGGSPAFVLAGSADFVMSSSNYLWIGIKTGSSLKELARMTP